MKTANKEKVTWKKWKRFFRIISRKDNITGHNMLAKTQRWNTDSRQIRNTRQLCADFLLARPA